MFANRFPGKCGSCARHVPAGEGFAAKRNGGWIAVCKSTACHRALGLASVPATQSAGIDARGVARFPYDAARVALVRAMPGARWVPVEAYWTVSTAPSDLPRVLELAERAGLEVAPELRAAANAGTAESREAEVRAEREGLYPFQRDGVRFLSLHSRALLADGMGTGKTIQTLVALPDAARGRVLVVCPKVVKYNWQLEAARWRPDYRVTALDGRKSFRLPEPGEIVVVNYDILPANAADMTGISVVLDEAHACKNRKALRTKRCTALCKTAARVWMLTGTPMTNRPFDLLSVLKTAGLDGQTFGGFNSFLRMFNGSPGQWGGYVFGAVEPEVGDRLRRVMLRRTLEEVLPELPSFRYQRIEVNGMTVEVRKQLDEIGAEFQYELDAGVLPPFERMSSVRAAIATSRIPAMLELVESYEDNDQPLVVFSAHRAPIDTLKDRDGWAVITGDTNAKRRTEIVEAFQAGTLKGIGLTITAGGVGITLTRAATVLFVDRDWTPANNAQAEDRLRRIGQLASSLHCVVLSSAHSVDKRVEQLLEEKITRFRDAMTSRLGSVRGAATPGLIEETDEQLAARLEAARAEAERIERGFWLDKIAEKVELKRKSLNGAAKDRPEPELTDEVKATIREAFQFMISRCDGAIEKDCQGFNKPDASVMHWINAAGGFSTDATYRLVELTLRTYVGQLTGFRIWE